MRKKVSILTESELVKLIKRVIKESVNSLFDTIISDINKMYKEIQYAESTEELEALDEEVYNFYIEIKKSKELNDDEKDELFYVLDQCHDLIGDMFKHASFDKENDI